ncbi:hypothetical protein [Streptomyces minutiscleroticus]|uniref:hypothetical protein n=1 Tax=Streptomyces minutiscleroticus TaxID=68238 RepID=UPI00331A69A9
MVGDMALLRTVLRTARTIKHSPRLSVGLPPDDDVLLDAPDGRLGPALVGAGRGEYGPASALLAATREAAEWEHRDRYAVRLAAFARSRPEWFERWRRAAPDDPDVLLLGAELAVTRAWASPARDELLRPVAPLIAAAAQASPGDPVPWRIALDHARGTHAPHTAFEELWAEAVRRSALHYGCHVSALQYLSAARRGSYRECFDFAERAAQDAAPGSPAQALPARAAFAYLTGAGPGGGVPPDGAAVPRARLDAAADLAIAVSRHHPSADPWSAEGRNVLAYVLAALERWRDALEQFRLTGPYATSFPWDRPDGDPLGRFLELRRAVRLEVARATPLCPRASDRVLAEGDRGGRSTGAAH